MRSRRGSPLLSALMLARVDGKSPVEYPGPDAAAAVRDAALALLVRPAPQIGDLIDRLDAGETPMTHIRDVRALDVRDNRGHPMV